MTDKWARDLPDDFLMCRDIGHTWRPLSARITADGTYERTMRCGRCKAERVQELSPSGVILSGHYYYEDGYLSPPGTGRMTSDRRAGMRVESIQRLLGHDEVEGR